MEYFYPARDRERLARDAAVSRLSLSIGTLVGSVQPVTGPTTSRRRRCGRAFPREESLVIGHLSLANDQ